MKNTINARLVELQGRVIDAHPGSDKRIPKSLRCAVTDELVGDEALITPSDYETLLSAPFEVDTLLEQAAKPDCLFSAFPEADNLFEVTNNVNLHKIENTIDLHDEIGGRPDESSNVEVVTAQEVFSFKLCGRV